MGKHRRARDRLSATGFKALCSTSAVNMQHVSKSLIKVWIIRWGGGGGRLRGDRKA